MWFALSLVQVEASLETINASAGIDELLLAGIERMALRANFHLDVLLGRLSLDHVAAVAGDGRLVQGRMDVLLHRGFTSVLHDAIPLLAPA